MYRPTIEIVQEPVSKVWQVVKTKHHHGWKVLHTTKTIEQAITLASKARQNLSSEEITITCDTDPHDEWEVSPSMQPSEFATSESDNLRKHYVFRFK
jgi:hypothetical protein